jgi:hypothetical protein
MANGTFFGSLLTISLIIGFAIYRKIHSLQATHANKDRRHINQIAYFMLYLGIILSFISSPASI